MQLSASVAGTFETRAVRKGHVATLLADKRSVEPGYQRPELNAEDAIRTADDFQAHRKTWTNGEAKTNLRELLVTAACAVRWK